MSNLAAFQNSTLWYVRLLCQRVGSSLSMAWDVHWSLQLQTLSSVHKLTFLAHFFYHSWWTPQSVFLAITWKKRGSQINRYCPFYFTQAPSLVHNSGSFSLAWRFSTSALIVSLISRFQGNQYEWVVQKIKNLVATIPI